MRRASAPRARIGCRRPGGETGGLGELVAQSLDSVAAWLRHLEGARAVDHVKGATIEKDVLAAACWFDEHRYGMTADDAAACVLGVLIVGADRTADAGTLAAELKTPSSYTVSHTPPRPPIDAP